MSEVAAATGRLSGAVLVERYHYTPGPAVALDRHSHEHVQLCYNPDYPGKVWIGGGWHLVPRGRLTLIPSGEIHAVRDVEDRVSSGSYQTMYLPPDLFGAARFRGFPFTGGDLATRFDRLHTALDGPAASALERDESLVMVVAELSARFAEAPPPSVAYAGRRAAVAARDLLLDRLDENVTLTDLAAEVNLSPYHLVRVFRREFGLTPHAYQVQARVDRAKLLLAGGGSVTRAAHDSGFFDSSHLTRHFRRVVGVPPGSYHAAR